MARLNARWASLTCRGAPCLRCRLARRSAIRSSEISGVHHLFIGHTRFVFGEGVEGVGASTLASSSTSSAGGASGTGAQLPAFCSHWDLASLSLSLSSLRSVTYDSIPCSSLRWGAPSPAPARRGPRGLIAWLPLLPHGPLQLNARGGSRNIDDGMVPGVEL